MRKVMVFVFMVTLGYARMVFQTDFENCSDSVPPGWIFYNLNGDEYAFAAVNNSNGAHSGNWYIRYKSRYANEAGDDWILSDTFSLTGNTLDTLEFYVRVQNSSYPEKLRVYLVKGNTPSDTIKLLWRNDSITNSTYQFEQVVFKSPASGIFRLGFYSNSDPGGRSIKVDDVDVKASTLAGDDISVTDVSPYLDGWIPDTLCDTLGEFVVTVKNLGTVFHSNVRTYYRVDSAGTTIIGPIQIGRNNFAGGEEYTYSFTWNPSIYHMAEYDLYVFHNASDDDATNDTFHMHFRIKGHQGRDSYGWVWRDSYSILGAPTGVTWIELSTDPNATDLQLPDEGNSFKNLASSIKYYGTDYYGINIDPNGIISFDQEPTGSDWDNDSIPSSNASAALMPFWEDLDPSSGGAVYFRTFGDTLTVVEWYQVPIYNMDSTVTFEVQIQSNLAQSGVYDNVTFLYYNMEYDENNMDATIGIQDSSARNGSGKFLYYTYNEQPYVPDWKNSKGIFAIKFYSPEALNVNEIAYDVLNRNKLHFALQNAITIDIVSNPVDVWVYDISGRKVTIPVFYKGRSLRLDFTSMRKGIYFVHIDYKKYSDEIKVINLK